MGAANMFFNSTQESKDMLRESSYYHISDVIEMMTLAKEDPRLDGLHGQELREKIIDLIAGEEWKVNA